MDVKDVEKNINEYIKNNNYINSSIETTNYFVNLFYNNNWKNIFDLENGKNILNLVFYSEIIKKFRCGIILHEKGYTFEAVGILRSVLEINNKLLGVRKKLFTIEESIGKRVTEKNENNSIERLKYRQHINREIKNNLYEKLSEIEKDIYKDFEYTFHSSLHNSSMSISSYIDGLSENNSINNLFYPEFDEKHCGVFSNTVYQSIARIPPPLNEV